MTFSLGIPASYREEENNGSRRLEAEIELCPDFVVVLVGGRTLVVVVVLYLEHQVLVELEVRDEGVHVV